jgi:hypothetical protein
MLTAHEFGADLAAVAAHDRMVRSLVIRQGRPTSREDASLAASDFASRSMCPLVRRT